MRYSLIVLLVSVLAGVGCGPNTQSNQVFSFSSDAVSVDETNLMVDGDLARIVRDQFGVPHIFAETNRGLFVAYGYAIAQDRLWQLETHRRAGRGTLQEAFGFSEDFDAADRVARIEGYSDGELDEMFDRLTDEEKTIFTAYVDGINRYIMEVVATDPENKLPVEFLILQLGIPAPYSTKDLVAFLTFLIRRFGEIGGRELRNQEFLDYLVGRHGDETVGHEIFNDARWLNDPDAPVTAPRPPPSLAVREGDSLAPRKRGGGPGRGAAVDSSYDDLREKAFEAWRSLGIPTKLGSYAWAVSPSRSKSGIPMLYGGPQMGFFTPEIVHNVELVGGKGFHVVGMSVAGGPGVIIGHNQDLAWTLTTQAAGDNLDIYRETLCDAGGGDGSGYEHKGECRPFESRVEVIPVRFGEPVTLNVQRSVHGPVVRRQENVAYTQKRAHWMKELETVSVIAGLDRTRNLEDFQKQVARVAFSFNVIYADQQGNIGYFVAGLNPVRPPGYDIRLPFPGDGSAEWPGGYRDNPFSINPEQGWLANWNNKPSVAYDSGDDVVLGKIDRVAEIQARFANGPISVEDMKDIPKDIARVKSLGRESRFLVPYLLTGLDKVQPSHSLAQPARKMVEAWDGNAFEDAISSTNLEAGEVIFSAWLRQVISDTFSDELGEYLSQASSNMLLHALDFAFTGKSGVPPSRDYFNGADPNAVISSAFDTIVANLARDQGDDPSLWTGPRGFIEFRHPIIGLLARINNSNRSTYGQVVVLERPSIRGQNIFSLGQSGFIKFVVDHYELDPHFLDLLPLYENFEYKPMELTNAPSP